MTCLFYVRGPQAADENLDCTMPTKKQCKGGKQAVDDRGEAAAIDEGAAQAKTTKPQKRKIKEPSSYLNLMSFFGCSLPDISKDVSKIRGDLKNAVNVVAMKLLEFKHPNFPNSREMRGFPRQAWFFEWHAREFRMQTEEWVMQVQNAAAWNDLGLSQCSASALAWANPAVQDAKSGKITRGKDAAKVSSAEPVCASQQFTSISMMPDDLSPDESDEEVAKPTAKPAASAVKPSPRKTRSLAASPRKVPAVVNKALDVPPISSAAMSLSQEDMPESDATLDDANEEYLPPAAAPSEAEELGEASTSQMVPEGNNVTETGEHQLAADLQEIAAAVSAGEAGVFEEVATVTTMMPYEEVAATGLLDPSVVEAEACARCARGARTGSTGVCA